MTSFERAALYHAHHSLHPEDLPFWRELAAAYPGPILELGCGSGRVLQALAQPGRAVFGLDLAPDMLAALRQSWGAAPPVFRADFCRFRLAPRLGLAVLPCNTYSTLDAAGRQALLGCVALALAPQGVFAASLPNPELLLDLPAHSAPQVEETLPHPWDGEPVQVSSAWRRTQRQFILTWYYDHLLPDGQVQRTTIETRHSLDPGAAYLDELRLAGFTVLETYGDYDRSPFASNSPQLIFVAQKA